MMQKDRSEHNMTLIDSSVLPDLFSQIAILLPYLHFPLSLSSLAVATIPSLPLLPTILSLSAYRTPTLPSSSLSLPFLKHGYPSQ